MHCNERNHTAICLKQAEPLKKEPSLHIINDSVAYLTVQAKIGGILCRAFLDSGSGQSYVSKEYARKLDIKTMQRRVTCYWDSKWGHECLVSSS